MDSEHLLALASDSDADVRAWAVEELCREGPVTWESLEAWAADPDERVREGVWFAWQGSWQAAGRLGAADRERWAALVAAVAEHLGGMPYVDVLGAEGLPWLEALWPHLGRLLDLGGRSLNSSIICGVLQDALVHGHVRPGAPALDAWLNGRSVERKMALLSVVQWFGAHEGWQRAIVEALVRDRSPIVSSTARALLQGRPVPDIQAREWAGNDLERC
ncbi:MAG: hypothetical protein HY321_05785 [Armatimonadetes bacterium]|nr:hypothetical protein [Armatimonadota bacterium]